MGMNVEEFYNMLPKHFWNKMEGFFDKIHMTERQKWERVRWQTTILLSPHTGKGKNIKPKDLIVFDWEKENLKIDFKGLKHKAELYKKMTEYGK